MKFKDKRILVTGGSSGIGFATGRRLLERQARLVISGRRQGVLNEAVTGLSEFGEVAGVCADIATSEGRAETLKQAISILGGLDVLVNNAGGIRAGSLQDLEKSEIIKMLDVNLLAPILLTKDALPALRAGGDSMVVNISSALALAGC